MVRIDARDSRGRDRLEAERALGGPPLLARHQLQRALDAEVSPTPLNGSDDSSNILLNRIGARRNTGGVYADPEGYLFVGPLSLDSGRGDLGRGDLGAWQPGPRDLGRGDLGRGGPRPRGPRPRGPGQPPGRGDLGRGDLGRGDLGGGDLFVGDPDSPGGELDFETATRIGEDAAERVHGVRDWRGLSELGTPLHAVSLGWTAPNVGGVLQYVVYRVAGTALVPDTPSTPWGIVGQMSAVPGQEGPYTLVDSSSRSRTRRSTPTSRWRRMPTGIQSDPSNLVTIIAVNDPPDGVANGVTALEDMPKAIAHDGVRRWTAVR